ncbi:OsmC family protein [Adhaeribacter rhizoryzae]|uniref:OsmC family peroxiredoxin n=1 Tax=Adhaeribacter rhizoryzae TaxID=2607907 RepID=A0A5M6D3D5_9BACT|nr:OsmC family protein [Adhaeribacter rhizoryzae]KAA5542007.1 OsmC family peroxiredoxin [Adhaeribacter rhizoryzae]
MSEYKVNLLWSGDTTDFTYKTYSRTHTWTFGGGSAVEASAAPEYLGQAELVNPEEAFAASLASCHLLTFLALAAFQKFIVERYEDEAVASVGKNAHGKMAVLQVTLNPKVTFSGDRQPTAEQLEQLHHKAHNDCFISNSVFTEVVVAPIL